MKRVFADTNYWVAVLNKNDQYHTAAISLDNQLLGVEIVTTDMVLVEVLNSFSAGGQFMRKLASSYVSELVFNAGGYYIIEQTRDQFVSALKLYSRYADKGWSLTDCVSHDVMQKYKITEVLTHDRHFQQMGFTTLLAQYEGDSK